MSTPRLGDYKKIINIITDFTHKVFKCLETIKLMVKDANEEEKKEHNLLGTGVLFSHQIVSQTPTPGKVTLRLWRNKMEQVIS